MVWVGITSTCELDLVIIRGNMNAQSYINNVLNPIEHLWDELGRRVRQRLVAPITLQDLKNALLQEWQNIPVPIITRYIISMSRRCVATVVARGGYTRY
jgi:hypothetical protein